MVQYQLISMGNGSTTPRNWVTQDEVIFTNLPDHTIRSTSPWCQLGRNTFGCITQGMSVQEHEVTLSDGC